jgi:prepilin signal peptidase PulO-like enzyme (type II secretory pathway)
MTVRYTERENAPPLTSCPVCGSPLKPIKNQTLAGGSVVLGQRCTRCDYWTHRARRVPVRYLISSAGIDGRPLQ